MSFAEAVEGLDGAWDEARSAEPSSPDFGPNQAVVNGEYIMQLTGCTVGATKLKKVKDKETGEMVDREPSAYMRCRYTIRVGDLAGETVKSYDSATTEERGGKTGLIRLSERLQNMGVNTKKIKSIRELPKVATMLNGNPDEVEGARPFVRANVVNTLISASESTSGKPQHFQNVYCNGLVDDEELSEHQVQYDEE